MRKKITTPLPVSRCFTLKNGEVDRLSEKLGLDRISENGITDLQVNSEQLEVTYDQQVYKFSDIVIRLSDSGYEIEKGILFGLKSAWLDYLDRVARENASAPPPSCCNKPPRRG